MSKAELTHGPARAIIAPHAGYQYCGACAAFAYRQISPAVVKRIFILGPSHHVRLLVCALSPASKYQTPFYDLTLDQEGKNFFIYLFAKNTNFSWFSFLLVYNELKATGEFDEMSIATDEAEHSIEMHLPYIAKVMSDFKNNFTIVPILVGSLTTKQEMQYGKLLAPYLADPQNLFVVSSDFCHWGERFRYTYYNKSWGYIHEAIQTLDETVSILKFLF